MGYSAYWKFQRAIDKAIAVTNNKGLKLDDHFNQAVEMVKLGSGSFRKVETFHLSRMACLIKAYISDFDRYNSNDNNSPLLPFELNPKE